MERLGGRGRRGGGGDSAAADPTSIPFPYATPAVVITLSLVVDLAEDQGTATLMETAPEGENRDGEGEAIKIIIVLQTCLYILTLIDTKNTIPHHVIVVVIKLLLLLNMP